MLTVCHLAEEAFDEFDLVLAGPGLELVDELFALVGLLVDVVGGERGDGGGRLGAGPGAQGAGRLRLGVECCLVHVWLEGWLG